jgi:hypothetical protein
MKKNFLKSAFVAAFAMVSMSALADNEFKIADVTVAPGGTAEMVIGFESSLTDIRSYEFKFVKPDGLEFSNPVQIDAAFDGGSADFGFSYSAKKNRYTFGVTEKDGEVILPGDYAKLTVTAAEDLAEGDITLNITNCEVTYGAGGNANVTLDPAPADFTVTIKVTKDTGIESVSVENNAPVYNLNGMLMNGNLQKGVYVQNGKKFIVK